MKIKNNLGISFSSNLEVHPLLKLISFIFLTFLIFSKISMLLHLALLVFTLLVLYFSGALSHLYKKLICLYFGVYCFLFFINWVFNKNPGFWDKNFLNKKYSDFAEIHLPFSFRYKNRGTGPTNASNSEEILNGWFVGGDLVKGCSKKGEKCCSCDAQSSEKILVVKKVEELKTVCECVKNGDKVNCCTEGGCCKTATDLKGLKSFQVLTLTENKFVGFLPKWYTLTATQFLLAFSMTNKLIMIIALSGALTHTTDLTAFTFSIGQLIRPLSFFKVPVRELTLIISLAVRFIPSLLNETMRIVKAQSSRGIDFKNGRLRDKATAFLSLFIPLFIISMMKSRELANAMLSRAYLPKAGRTSYKTYSLNSLSLVIFGAVISFIFFCYYSVLAWYYSSFFGHIDPLLLVAI